MYTAVIDYGAGNINSVEKAIRSLGGEVKVTRDRDEILSAGHIILPGVGAFGDAMDMLGRSGLDDVVREAAGSGIPFLGICLGLQLIFEESEESPGVKGLSLLKGRIKHFPEDKGLKIPQIGWNDLSFPRPGRLFEGLEQDNNYVYFVHSYYLEAGDESVVTATCEYGVTVHASIEKDNIFACQFHPEKSGDTGMRILDNFLKVDKC